MLLGCLDMTYYCGALIGCVIACVNQQHGHVAAVSSHLGDHTEAVRLMTSFQSCRR